MTSNHVYTIIRCKHENQHFDLLLNLIFIVKNLKKSTKTLKRALYTEKRELYLRNQLQKLLNKFICKDYFLIIH